jgi:hypothetical protein
VEAWVHSQVTSCGICGEQSDTGISFTLSTLVFPCELFLQFSVLVSRGGTTIGPFGSEYQGTNPHPTREAISVAKIGLGKWATC